MSTVTRVLATLLCRLLRLFPAPYRREYQEERACVLRLALEEQAARGWLPLLRFCAREVRDLPPAIGREHWREWRRKMNGSQQFEAVGNNGLRGWHLLWFALPFLVVLIHPLLGLIVPGVWDAFAPLLIVTIVVAVAGFSKGMPRWALPSLGLGLSVINLLILQTMFGAVLDLSTLRAVLWTYVMAERVLYALIMNALSLAPILIILLLLALAAITLPGLAGLRNLLAQEWTVLPFLLYTTNLLTPFVPDDYEGLQPYQLLFLLILAAGTWVYLQASRQGTRFVALLATTLLSGAVLSLGIYLVYPQQSWIYGVGGNFPRWWEALNPLLETAVRLVALGLLAIVGRWLVGRLQVSRLQVTG